jgi:hypothetical protein
MATNADDLGRESGRKPATEARKTKSYIVKKGLEITHIKDGEHQTVTGDGSATVDLTEEQAVAFGDKLEGEADETTQTERNMRNAQTIVVGEETGGAATINEAAAAAGQAQGINSEDVEDGAPGADTGAEGVAGQQTADVSKVGAGSSEAGKATKASAEKSDSKTGGASASSGSGSGSASAPAKS